MHLSNFYEITHIPNNFVLHEHFYTLLYSQTSIIRGTRLSAFWGQNLVCPTYSYMKYSQTSIIRTSFIRGFWDQNLVRPSTADNRGLNVETNVVVTK